MLTTKENGCDGAGCLIRESCQHFKSLDKRIVLGGYSVKKGCMNYLPTKLTSIIDIGFLNRRKKRNV